MYINDAKTGIIKAIFNTPETQEHHQNISTTYQQSNTLHMKYFVLTAIHHNTNRRFIERRNQNICSVKKGDNTLTLDQHKKKL